MTLAPSRPRGRPRGSKNSIPEVIPPVSIEVSDQRAELQSRVIATFRNVSGRERRQDTICRFGIAEHLHVVRILHDGTREAIQQGRR